MACSLASSSPLGICRSAERLRHRRIPLRLAIVCLAALAVSGCQAASGVEQEAATYVAQTFTAAAQVPTQTPRPPTATPTPTLTPTPTDTPTPTPTTLAGGGRLAFVSDRFGNLDLFVMMPDGSGLTRLTETKDHEFGPDWSPDGTQLAYYTPGDLRVIHSDGTGGFTLRQGPIGPPSWSSDGKIAFAMGFCVKNCRFGSGPPPPCELKSGAPADITAYNACLSNNPAQYTGDVYTIDSDGSRFGVLTFRSKIYESPAWSPDAKHLVYVFDDRLYLYEVSTGDEIRITDVASSDPAWSPDGLWVAFASRGNILAVNIETREVRMIIDDAWSNSHPTWSPDGRWIAYASERDKNIDIFAIELESGTLVRLTDDPGKDIEPDWSWP